MISPVRPSAKKCVSPEGIALRRSAGKLALLGYSIPELRGRQMFDFVHPDDYPVALQAFQDELKMNHVVQFINIRLLKKDGTWTWCMVRGHNMLYNPYIGKIGIYFYDDMDLFKEKEYRS